MQYFKCLFAKVFCDSFHSGNLIHLEGAAAVAVTALNAGGSLLLQALVVVACQGIACLCEVVILVDQANVQTHRARLAVIAVDAYALGFLRRKAANHGIVCFFGLCIQECKYTPQISNVTDTRKNCQHAARPKGEVCALRSCPPQNGFMTEMPTPADSHFWYSAIRSETLPIPYVPLL